MSAVVLTWFGVWVWKDGYVCVCVRADVGWLTTGSGLGEGYGWDNYLRKGCKKGNPSKLVSSGGR